MFQTILFISIVVGLNGNAPDLRGNIPAFLSITDGKVHDVKAAPQIQIEPEGIYVVDRAYVDFDWLWSIETTGAYGCIPI